ncbi:MAG: hypothetical protein LBC99_04775 [Spirochaetota bacterium]|jgi:hypothetical protein|nr:hypothetical protein [Spirochaetota bacterium]
MKKSLLKIAIALGLACLTGLALLACNSSAKATDQERDTARARKTAEKAGIDTEKNSAVLITRRDLRDNTRVTIIGVLRQVGTARFPEVVITPPAGFDVDLNIDKKSMDKYAELYNNYVTVTGLLKIELVRYGDIERERYSMTLDAPPKLVL